MVTKELLDFIKAQMEQGATRAALEAQLIPQGWQPQDLAEAFAAVAPKPVPPAQPAPVAPAASAPTVNPMTNPATPSLTPTSQPIQSSQQQQPYRPVYQPTMQQAAQPMGQMGASAAPVGAPALGYAGFWRRLVAASIDLVILQVIAVLLVVALVKLPHADKIAPFVAFIVAILYYVLLESSSKQGTVGKMVSGIQVTSLDGSRISFLRALGRYFGKLLSVATFGIGFLIAAFTAKKQGLHDMMAGTLVVRYKESHVGQLIVTALLIVCILGGGTIAFAYYYLLPKLGETFSAMVGSVSSMTISSTTESTESADSIDATAETIQNPLSRSEYEALLAKPVDGLEGIGDFEGAYTHAGPALISFPLMFVNVALPVIPNVEDAREKNDLKLTRVYSKAGKDILDKESPFEKNVFFTSLNFSKVDYPATHLKGFRAPHIVEGAKEEDIAKIEGVLTLMLPLKEGGDMTVSYPFVLDLAAPAKAATSTPASAAAPARVTTPEEDAVIAGVLRSKEVFLSADASRIRGYLLKTMTDPASKKELDETSDKDLLMQADFAGWMYEGVTAALLKSASTTVAITGDKASIKFTSPDGGKTTLSATKIDGVWY